MNKIGGYQNRPVQLGVDKKVSRSEETSVATPATGPATTASPVSITDQAKQLASLQQNLLNLPAIDEGRVAEIRTAIQEGRYQIDPGRVADKLLRMEQELRG